MTKPTNKEARVMASNVAVCMVGIISGLLQHDFEVLMVSHFDRQITFRHNRRIWLDNDGEYVTPSFDMRISENARQYKITSLPSQSNMWDGVTLDCKTVGDVGRIATFMEWMTHEKAAVLGVAESRSLMSDYMAVTEAWDEYKTDWLAELTKTEKDRYLYFEDGSLTSEGAIQLRNDFRAYYNKDYDWKRHKPFITFENVINAVV